MMIPRELSFKFFIMFMFGIKIAYSNVEFLELDIIPYGQLLNNDPAALIKLNKALYEKGIVGVSGVSGYREKYDKFILAAKKFYSLPDEIKDLYVFDKNNKEFVLGYDKGSEKFQTSKGNWIIDNLKNSYYALVPDSPRNIWPSEINLKESYEDLAQLMFDVGECIMYKIGLIGNCTGLTLEKESGTGRMLYYKKSDNFENHLWCGSHFDHGLFTVVLPAIYFIGEERVFEPEEAGLFVRTSPSEPFKKVMANDIDVMMFQVGEFGQLVMNDKIKATEHCVNKAFGPIERYTLAVFYNAPMDVHIYSKSVLMNDSRAKFGSDGYCTYRKWQKASYERYLN